MCGTFPLMLCHVIGSTELGESCAGFHITRNLQTHMRSLSGSLGSMRSTYGHAWTCPKLSHLFLPIPCVGSVDIIFPTAV